MARKLSNEEAEAIDEQLEDNKMEDTVGILVDAELKNGEEYTEWFKRDRSEFKQDEFTAWYMNSNPNVVEMSLDVCKDGKDGKDVLEHISGVGEREAEILHDHGYHSEEEIRKAEQMELAGIEGFGNVLAARMKADVGGLGVDDSEQSEDDECNSPKLGMLNIGSVDSNGLTFDSIHRVYRYNDEDIEIEVGDDVDEITLKKDGEERTVDVDEVFGEEEMECTCGPNEACSECPDEKCGFSTGEKMSVTLSNENHSKTFGKSLVDIEEELEDVEIDPEFAEKLDGEIEGLEQESHEDREVCSAQYCENWQSECEKH